jgi:hypothetical protein
MAMIILKAFRTPIARLEFSGSHDQGAGLATFPCKPDIIRNLHTGYICDDILAILAIRMHHTRCQSGAGHLPSLHGCSNGLGLCEFHMP